MPKTKASPNPKSSAELLALAEHDVSGNRAWREWKINAARELFGLAALTTRRQRHMLGVVSIEITGMQIQHAIGVRFVQHHSLKGDRGVPEQGDFLGRNPGRQTAEADRPLQVWSRVRMKQVVWIQHAQWRKRRRRLTTPIFLVSQLKNRRIIDCQAFANGSTGRRHSDHIVGDKVSRQTQSEHPHPRGQGG